jgi:hypothetical protein
MVEMLIENIQKDDNNMMKERERMNEHEFFSHFFSNLSFTPFFLLSILQWFENAVAITRSFELFCVIL